jgi:Spy/CpxP family protein refolding chaperone
MEHHRYHHRGDVTLLIAMSIDTVGVSPEQRAAVEKIRTDLHSWMDPARMAEQNLMVALAEGLSAGNIDVAMVDASVMQVTVAAATVHDASAYALNELHDALTPPQREALVDEVESHWAHWQKANAEETGPVLTVRATDFRVTADQMDKIRAGLGEGMKATPRLDPQEIATQVRAFGDAFRREKFDAKELTTASGANGRMIDWGAADMAHFVETVNPVLTPEQRAKLARRLRDDATQNASAQAKP